MTPRRLVFAALVIAAVAIAITFWVGNAGGIKASDCVPQLDAAKKVDAAATGQLAALNGTGTGRGYADLNFTDKDGKPVKLSDFAGKFLLVNFWASWCIPCRAEMPALDKLAAEENGPDFMVLPINLDVGSNGLDKARKFIGDGGWTHFAGRGRRSWHVHNASAVHVRHTLKSDNLGRLRRTDACFASGRGDERFERL